MTITEAFAYTEAKLSGSGTNTKWMNGSQRGFRASGKLAITYFGADTKLLEISHGDCLNFVERLADIPDNWGKGPGTRLPMSQLIQATNDLEEFGLSALEHEAEAERWSDERFNAACEGARIDRLAPRTQYKHQSYLSQVFKTIILASEQGKNPMKDAIWTRKEREKRVREGGVRRVALGPEGRAALFSRPLFVNGPDACDAPLFWLPLVARYQGLRMEECCQLKPEDIGEEEGIAVLRVRAGLDQTVKSESLIRTLPIHPELIRLGIVRLAARKQAAAARWLLGVERHKDGSFTSRYSKIYHNWRRAQDIYEPGKDFHSLRKDYYQDLKGAGVDYAARVVLMGHAINDISETHYGHLEWTLADRTKFIGVIPVDTGHISPVA